MTALISAERFFRRWLSKHGCFEVEMLYAATHAVTSAYFSIACALSVTVFSIATGSREDSISLFGVAIMSLVDLTGSLLVLYRWRFMSRSYSKTQIQRVEVYFAAAIGVLMGLLGITLFQTSVIKLIVHDTPVHVGYGVVVGLYGAVTSFVLFFYKHRIGRVLQSLVVLADAKCSLCVCLISSAVALALLLQHKMWWADGVMGALVASYVMHEAYISLKASVQELRGLADESEGMGLMAMAFKTASSGSFHEPEDTGEEEEEETKDLMSFEDGKKKGLEFHI